MLFTFDKTKKLRKNIQPVLDMEEKYRTYTDEQLKAETKRFQKMFSDSTDTEKALKQIRLEAFAVVREAAFRVRDELMYPEQLMGGYVLSEGDVAEMKTGEGKSLTALLPTYLNALSGKGVHVITVNEYLAARDAENIGKVLEWLGLSVGVNLQSSTHEQKQHAYACDVTYTTNSEAGFDYLRDNMAHSLESRVMRGLNFALIDEADSILIDDSRTPLIISGGKQDDSIYYHQADKFAKSLKANTDYVIDERVKAIQLTEEGMEKAVSFFKLSDNLYSPDNSELLHYVTNALRANYIFIKDIDYIVRNDEVFIVDPNTGRVMDGRQWSNGIHQAVEVKEGCKIQPETVTVATITYQNFFRLYNKLAGMTGTAKTEEEEFLDIYNMRVVEVPTHKPVIRQDLPDDIYGTKRAKYNAIVKEVQERHSKGQPILVGTPSVEVSEVLSEMFKKARIPHVVLNAKDNTKEADIIAHAGQKGAVTVATNMAGRGTDIKLGEGVAELGGLAVIGSERHEARRIDNQLRGRSGRQGDPGVSKFFISVQDDIVKRFGSERLEEFFKSFGDEKIDAKNISKAVENAQKRVEGVNYDARKNLLKYDDVMGRQREEMYSQRNKILNSEDIHETVLGLFKKAIKSCFILDDRGDIDKEATEKALKAIGINTEIDVKESISDMSESLYEGAKKWYEDKVKENPEIFSRAEPDILLQVFDANWCRHINTMDHLRNGIGLRGYAQKDPLQAYVAESYELFDGMTTNIAREMTGWCMTAKITTAN